MQSIPKILKEKCRGVNGKQLALKCAPYVIFGYVFNKVSWLYGQQAGDNTLQKVLDTINGMGGAFVNPFPSFMPGDLLVGVGCGIGFRMVVYYKAKNAKKFRQGVEYGSARWGTAKDIEPYVDPVFENNVLLTATERLMMSGRPKQPKYARNKNILVIGGSGSGKTRFFVKPNLMQMHSSYVVTDPKGTVLVECGKMLSKNNYRIKVLNTINFAKSMHYNPFAYIRSEKDILKLVNTIIVNTKGEGQQASEDFWVKAEKLYYTALIAYIWYEAPEEEQNFSMLIDLVDASEAKINNVVETGKTIQRMRKRYGITRKDLADRTGLSVDCVFRIETGKNRNIDYNHINLIARELLCTTDFLIGESCDPTARKDGESYHYLASLGGDIFIFSHVQLGHDLAYAYNHMNEEAQNYVVQTIRYFNTMYDLREISNQDRGERLSIQDVFFREQESYNERRKNRGATFYTKKYYVTE